jgi:hypothetical protein
LLGDPRWFFVVIAGCPLPKEERGTLLIANLTPEADSETATLAWLMEALECVRSKGQTKAVSYLEEVADDVVFEVEMVARRASLVE